MSYTGDRDIAKPKALSSSLPSEPRVGDREGKGIGKKIKAIRRENAELAVMGFDDPNDETYMGTSEPEPKKKKFSPGTELLNKIVSNLEEQKNMEKVTFLQQFP